MEDKGDSGCSCIVGWGEDDTLCLWLRNISHTSFKVLTAVVTKISIFWDIMPCIPLKVNRRFGRSCLHFPSRIISQARNQRETGSNLGSACLRDAGSNATRSSETSVDFQRTTRLVSQKTEPTKHSAESGQDWRRYAQQVFLGEQMSNVTVANLTCYVGATGARTTKRRNLACSVRQNSVPSRSTTHIIASQTTEILLLRQPM
jgi:hypothetical protein